VTDPAPESRFEPHLVPARLVTGETLGEDEAAAVFEALLGGELDEAQIGGILALIQSRGVTADELVGAARAMRAHVTPVPFTPEPGESLIDTCGTGGAAKTFNVSTAAALVAAAAEPPAGSAVARVVVAKHGNRSRTGRGSAEVLAGLGVNIEASPNIQARCLREAGVCFSFAMRHHPAMRHAAGPRRSLGFPTIFNLLGPLTNPAQAPRQLLGVYRPEFVGLVASALARLGSTAAAVVHGAGGLDEVSTLGPSEAVWVCGGETRSEPIDPAGLVPTGSIEALRAADLNHGIRMVRGVLAGEAGAARDIVVLNAAVAIMLAGAAADLGTGVGLASAAIDSGRAARVLDTLGRLSRE
jgi:anthranilate phosphoribosyltransferase